VNLECIEEPMMNADYLLPEIPLALERERLEGRGALERAMSALSPVHRAVVELAYVGGFSCEEIGAIMRCPAATVNARLSHARRQLRVGLGANIAPCWPAFSQSRTA
jgi:RNA polymerase sigma factor (sigma-70 family)